MTILTRKIQHNFLYKIVIKTHVLDYLIHFQDKMAYFIRPKGGGKK